MKQPIYNFYMSKEIMKYWERFQKLGLVSQILRFIYQKLDMPATSGLHGFLFVAVFVNNLMVNMDGCVLQVDRVMAIESVFFELQIALMWQVVGKLTTWLVSQGSS